MTTGNTTGRLINQTSDKWGRWVSQIYRGKQDRNLTIICAYQVVSKAQQQLGDITAEAQQQSLILKEGGYSQRPHPHPRQKFRNDLKKYLKSLKAKGNKILLLGDFNENVGDEHDEMSAIVAALQLTDLIRIRYSNPPPTTYNRGRMQLEYDWGTQVVADSVQKCGFEAFNARYNTDHRAYFLDLSITTLFGNETQSLASYETSGFQTSNLRQNTEYLEKKYSLFNQHNVFAERVKQLAVEGQRRDQFAERLDRDIVNACLAA